MPWSVLSVLVPWTASFVGSLRAQDDDVKIQYPIPEKIERAAVADDKGILQWVEWSAGNCKTCKGSKVTDCVHCSEVGDNAKCLECNMKKKAPCRSCGGLGSLPDPLKQVHCPGCMGAGMMPCTVCGGRGGNKVQGGGKDQHDCVACKGDAGFACTICSGARMVDCAKLAPSLAEAPLEALKRAQGDVEASLRGLAAFRTGGKNTRKELKEYGKGLKPGTSSMPMLKKFVSGFDAYMERIIKGELWVGHEEREGAAMEWMKKNTEYYLKVQKRMLELAIQRAEQNAKAKAGK
jgi:hypothetical protein